MALALVLVAAGALGFAVANHFRVIGGPNFVEGLVTNDRPLALDPLAAPPDQGADDIGHLLYRSLLRLDASAYPLPDLAASYSVSSDGLRYTLPLRPGVRWSDGRPVTAADVVATFQFAASAKDADRALATALAPVKVRVVGARVTLSLVSPRASLPALLTQVPILPLGGLAAQQLSHLVGNPEQVLATTGPYSVSGSSASDLTLAANPYAAAPPHMQSVDVRLYPTFSAAAAAFAHGDIDGLLATTPAERAQLLSTPGAHAHDIATFRFVDLLFNERMPAFADSAVRQAFAVAVDRARLLSGALHGGGGLMQVNAMPEGIRWIATPNPREPASPSAAASALQADGWGVGPAGVRVKAGMVLAFTVTVPDVPPLPAVAHDLATELAPLGITLLPDPVPASQFVARSLVPRHFETALGDWDNGPDPDVSAFWRSNATPPRGYNVSGAAPDPFLDQALDSLATLSDRQARIAAAGQVDRLLAQDAPAVFLYAPEVSYVFRVPMRSAPIPAVGGSAARFDDITAWQRG